MRRAILAAALSLAAARAFAADPVEGVWLVEDGDAKVRIGPCPAHADQICGEVVWLQAPRDEAGDPKHDARNPDPRLRSRPILGLAVIRDFHAAGRGRWAGGKIYDPHSGRTYDSRLRIAADGTLKVDGCVLMFCEAQTWRRAS